MRFKDYPTVEQILMVAAFALALGCVILIPSAVLALAAVD